MEEIQAAQPRPSEIPAHAFAQRPSYKWCVTWTIMLGAFLFALDTTIVNIAIPKIMTSISADLNQIQWVLIVYMVGMTTAMPTTGWLPPQAFRRGPGARKPLNPQRNPS